MKLDIGVNVLTLPFEVNTLTIGHHVKNLAIGSHIIRFLSCDLKIGVITGNVLY